MSLGEFDRIDLHELRNKLDQEATDIYETSPQIRRLDPHEKSQIQWRSPSILFSTTVTLLQKGSCIVTERGVSSLEKDVQLKREMNALSVTYFSVKDMPNSPNEPDQEPTGLIDDTTVLIIPAPDVFGNSNFQPVYNQNQSNNLQNAPIDPLAIQALMDQFNSNASFNSGTIQNRIRPPTNSHMPNNRYMYHFNQPQNTSGAGSSIADALRGLASQPNQPIMGPNTMGGGGFGSLLASTINNADPNQPMNMMNTSFTNQYHHYPPNHQFPHNPQPGSQSSAKRSQLKSGKECLYFKNGYCMHGDNCKWIHVPK